MLIAIIVVVAIAGYFVYQTHGTPQNIQNEANKIIQNTNNTIQQMSSQVDQQSVFNSQNNMLVTTANNILTEDNYYAQLVPTNIQVTDKGRYNVISLTVTVNVQNLPFYGNVHFEDLYTTLEDQHAKMYQPDPQECSLNDLIPIVGKQATSASYNVCYSVDKTANKFSILYSEPQNDYHIWRAGYLSLDTNLTSYYQSHYNPQPIQIGTISLTNNP